jgi:D-alanine-D-alanine ligase
MRCCILYNQPGPHALADELDIINQVEYVESNIEKLGIESYRKGITSGFMDEMAELSVNRPDFVFNLVESISNKGELLYFIPAILNMYNLPYTGNPLEAMFLTTSKVISSRMLEAGNISAPKWFLPSQCSLLEPGKQYIIKPVWEDGSLGITSDSVFTYSQELDAELKKYTDSHWIIQEFIDGREFNISIISGKNGAEILPPAEMTFVGYDESRPKIVDFKAKWEEDSFECKNTVRKFPGDRLDQVLERRLRVSTLKCWDIFGLKGYARVDFRVDANSIPYVIEINANPCISPDGGFVAATKEAGFEFTDILNRIISDMNT